MELVEGTDMRLDYSRHESINDVLQKYHSTATNSLSGPKDSLFAGRSVSVNEGKDETVYVSVKNGKRMWKRRHQEGSDNGIVKHFEIQCNTDRKLFEHLPTQSAGDESWDELQITSLQGELISCFIIGGEKRLCLPQVLNSTLRGVSVVDINNACDFLHIFCSTCSERQLCMLKKHRVLPPLATQCGLISKTDAERLCNWLLFESRPCSKVTGHTVSSLTPDPDLLHVQHTCFGRCRGTLDVTRYSSPLAGCIACEHCGRRFSPRRFVAHAHGNRETRVVHWGFDSDNWRQYLLLCRPQKDLDHKQQLLEDVKNRFVTSTQKYSSVDVPPEKRILLAPADPVTGVGAPSAPVAHLSSSALWSSSTLLGSDGDKATDLTIGSSEPCDPSSKPPTPLSDQPAAQERCTRSPGSTAFNLSSKCVSESSVVVTSLDRSLPAPSSLSSVVSRSGASGLDSPAPPSVCSSVPCLHGPTPAKPVPCSTDPVVKPLSCWSETSPVDSVLCSSVTTPACSLPCSTGTGVSSSVPCWNDTGTTSSTSCSSDTGNANSAGTVPPISEHMECSSDGARSENTARFQSAIPHANGSGGSQSPISPVDGSVRDLSPSDHVNVSGSHVSTEGRGGVLSRHSFTEELRSSNSCHASTQTSPPSDTSCCCFSGLLDVRPTANCRTAGEEGCTGDSVTCLTQLSRLINFQVDPDPDDEDVGISGLPLCSCSEETGVAARLGEAVRRVCDEESRQLLATSIQQLSRLAIKQQLSKLPSKHLQHTPESHPPSPDRNASIPESAKSLSQTSHESSGDADDLDIGAAVS